MMETSTIRTFSISMLLLLATLASTEALAFDPHLPLAAQQHVSLLQQTAAPLLSHNDHFFQHSSITTTVASAATTTFKDTLSHPQQIVPTLYDHYKAVLAAKPFQTKIMTGCTLAVVGDAIAQQRTEPEYNFKRAASFVAFDGCWRAVQVLTYKPLIETCTGKFSWNLLQTLPFLSPQTNPDISLLGAMEQTLVSQLVMIPLIYYPVFYATTGLVQGLTVEETITRAKETFIPLMKRNLMFWIPTQFAVFGFVEENLQIPILIVCGLAWTIILSLSAGNASEEQPAMALADGGVVESNMAELGAVESAMGLNSTGFFYGANVTAYYGDDNEFVDSDASFIKTISNIQSPQTSNSEREMSQ